MQNVAVAQTQELRFIGPTAAITARRNNTFTCHRLWKCIKFNYARASRDIEQRKELHNFGTK